MSRTLESAPLTEITPAIGRSLETQAQYTDHVLEKRLRDDHSCDLCTVVGEHSIDPRLRAARIGERVIELATPGFAVIRNDFPYNNYDGHEALEHDMLVPTSHIDFDAMMRDRELRHARADAEAEILERFPGYYHTIMSRTSASAASSIPGHAHTHLFHLGRTIIKQDFSIKDGRNDLTFGQ